MGQTLVQTFSPNVHLRKTFALGGSIRGAKSVPHQHPQQISRILQLSLKSTRFKFPEFILYYWCNKND